MSILIQPKLILSYLLTVTKIKKNLQIFWYFNFIIYHFDILFHSSYIFIIYYIYYHSCIHNLWVLCWNILTKILHHLWEEKKRNHMKHKKNLKVNLLKIMKKINQIIMNGTHLNKILWNKILNMIANKQTPKMLFAIFLDLEA